MMKKILSVVVIAMMLGITSCGKKNIIPDDTLANIFHDAFVVNAYIGEEHINLDSLQIYEPIFNKYGYTAKDVVYTVGNFSRRKSARLGSVVEQAISRLENESKEYAKRVVILDTIRNVAIRTFTHKVYEDSLIQVKKLADTVALHVEISPIQVGEYTISYEYRCLEDVDKYPRRAEFYFEERDGSFRNGYTSASLRQMGKMSRTLVSKRNGNGQLVLNLGKSTYKGKKRPKKQGINIRNLKVVYKPTEKMAIDSLFNQYVDIKIFADGFLIKKDSLTLSPDSTRVSTTPPDNN